MRKRFYIIDLLFAAGILAGMWWLVLQFISGVIPHLVHSRAQTFFAVLTIVIVLAAWLAGILVAASERMKQAAHTWHFPHLRLRLHH